MLICCVGWPKGEAEAIACWEGWPKAGADAPLWRDAKGLVEAGAPNRFEVFAEGLAGLPKGVVCEGVPKGFGAAPAGAGFAAAKGLFIAASLFVLKPAKEPPLFAVVEPRPLEIGALGLPKAGEI